MGESPRSRPPRTVALTREPSASLAACELSFLDRRPIDLERARVEHARYRAALRAAGLDVVVLPPLDALPDAVFVEDAAVVVDEIAVLTAPGAASRAAEPEAIGPALTAYRPVRRLAVPGATLEGGDVLRIGRTLYVGRSSRTNEAGIAGLRALLEPHGYRIRAVPVGPCLHLKTGCTHVGHGAVLLNPEWVPAESFEADGLRVVPVDPGEPWAANTLLVGGALLVPSGHPSTRRVLEGLDLRVDEVDIGELRKAEGGLTCLSLVIEPAAFTPPAGSTPTRRR